MTKSFYEDYELTDKNVNKENLEYIFSDEYDRIPKKIDTYKVDIDLLSKINVDTQEFKTNLNKNKEILRKVRQRSITNQLKS